MKGLDLQNGAPALPGSHGKQCGTPVRKKPTDGQEGGQVLIQKKTRANNYSLGEPAQDESQIVARLYVGTSRHKLPL